MSEPRIGAGIALTIALAAALTACRTNAGETPPAQTRSAAASTAAPAGAPHGDHNPRHGGVVLMKGEMHYEVVLDPAGRTHQVFFSDAVRDDLPASVASGVALTIRRPGAADEMIPLQIDNTGESWIGSGSAVTDEAKTTVRIAFTISDEPYFIDVPFRSRDSSR
jgi:hypothetical protein